MEPKDRKYTRKGEPDGPKLSPGERAINWAKALAIVIPLMGVGAVANTATVKKWVGLSEISGEIDTPVSADIHPEVRQKLESIIAKLSEHGEALERTQAKAGRGDSGLKQEIKALKDIVERWHGE